MGFEADRFNEDAGMDEVARTVQAETKGIIEKADMEKLVEKFSQWADERILALKQFPHDSPFRPPDFSVRVIMLNWAKVNLKRLAKEIKG